MPRIPPGTETFPAREPDRDFDFEYARPSKRSRERAMLGAQKPKTKPKRKSKARRGTISPLGVTGKPSGQAPRGRTRARQEVPGPTPPEVTMDLTKLGPSRSPEVERSQAISAALLKGAAFVQPSSISGALQGLLSGAGLGLEIDAAMQQYRDRKRSASESARARKLAAGPTQRPPMRANYGRSPDYEYATQEAL
ncbi:hypothetical protein AMJ85_00295 [candidate division BRC1 bacterium SM23_51]|nr:MAG: hypothetical protein AMJ85_00295 [candidate division BRC1 bacterium SM23_51]